jgi:hypothetical protein
MHAIDKKKRSAQSKVVKMMLPNRQGNSDEPTA